MKRILCMLLLLMMLCLTIGCTAEENADDKVQLYPFFPTITDSFGKTIDEWYDVRDGLADLTIPNLLLASLAYDINVGYPDQISFNTGDTMVIGKSNKNYLSIYFPAADFDLHIMYMPDEDFSVFRYLYDYTFEDAIDEFVDNDKCEKIHVHEFPWDSALGTVYAQAIKINSQENADVADGTYRELKPGSEGKDVLAARIKLYELGYFKKKPTQTEYTENMKDYVKKFEKDNGLKQDGILSPEDQEVLFGR